MTSVLADIRGTGDRESVAAGSWNPGAWSLPEVRWAAVATALLAGGLAARLAYGPAWLAWALFLACYAAGGWEPGLAGLRALRDRVLDVDLLMVGAAIGAAAIGQVLDGGLLIVIFATSGASSWSDRASGLRPTATSWTVRATSTRPASLVNRCQP